MLILCDISGIYIFFNFSFFKTKMFDRYPLEHMHCERPIHTRTYYVVCELLSEKKYE